MAKASSGVKGSPKKGAAAKRPATPGRRRLWFAWASGLLLLVTVAIVVLRRGEGIKFADLVQHARPGWLLVAVVLQVGT